MIPIPMNNPKMNPRKRSSQGINKKEKRNMA